jgi:rubrerythrin
MSERPSYLGLLNSISLAEMGGHCFFTAWIGVTRNPDVKRVLQTIAAREGEHSLAFAKRIDELGFELETKVDPKHDANMAIAASDRPDVEKFEALGLCDVSDGVLTYFDTVFKDHTIDVRTGELLGRYIAEEHDTARLLKSCYLELKGASASVANSSELAALNDKVDGLCAAVEQLQAAVLDQLAPAGASKNGKGRAKVGAQ